MTCYHGLARLTTGCHSLSSLKMIEVSKTVLLCLKAGFEPSRNGQNDLMWRQNGDMDSEKKTTISRAQFSQPI
jgi:hypothetical protein